MDKILQSLLITLYALRLVALAFEGEDVIFAVLQSCCQCTVDQSLLETLQWMQSLEENVGFQCFEEAHGFPERASGFWGSSHLLGGVAEG